MLFRSALRDAALETLEEHGALVHLGLLRSELSRDVRVLLALLLDSAVGRLVLLGLLRKESVGVREGGKRRGCG